MVSIAARAFVFSLGIWGGENHIFRIISCEDAEENMKVIEAIFTLRGILYSAALENTRSLGIFPDYILSTASERDKKWKIINFSPLGIKPHYQHYEQRHLDSLKI